MVDVSLAKATTIGDLHNNVVKLESLARGFHYPTILDTVSIQKGDPRPLLGLLHHVLLDASKYIAGYLVQSGYELCAKTDAKFIDGVFKFVRNEFQYNPSLTPVQFLSNKCIERKIMLVCMILAWVKEKHVALKKEKQRAATTWTKAGPTRHAFSTKHPTPKASTVSTYTSTSDVGLKQQKAPRNPKNSHGTIPRCTVDTFAMSAPRSFMGSQTTHAQASEDSSNAALRHSGIAQNTDITKKEVSQRDPITHHDIQNLLKVVKGLEHSVSNVGKEMMVRLAVLEARLSKLEISQKENIKQDIEPKQPNFITAEIDTKRKAQNHDNKASMTMWPPVPPKEAF